MASIQQNPGKFLHRKAAASLVAAIWHSKSPRRLFKAARIVRSSKLFAPLLQHHA